MIGLGLSITQLAVRQLLGFNPLSLFAANEPGVWYDPSDLTTMFQDAAGTVLVTAVEQPVGLILDKSRGLVLGPELVVNGTFDGGSSAGWTLNSGATIEAEKLALNIPTANVSSVYSVVEGRTYAWEFTVSNYTSGSINFSFGGGTRATVTANGTYRGVAGIVPSTTSVRVLSVGSPVASIDNISVREIPGAHATQSTATSRPVLSARINKLLATAILATQSVTTRATPHTLRFEGTGSVTLSGTATGTFAAGSHSITTTAGTLTITVSGSVTLADLRETNEGVGLPVYQAVVTATNYDASAGRLGLRFDGIDDSLVTPTITPGIDKAQIFAGVRKLSDAALGVVVELGNALPQGSFLMSAPFGASPSYGYSVRGLAAGFGGSAGGFFSPHSAVNILQIDLSGGTGPNQVVLPVRINGDVINVNVAGTAGGDFLAYPLYIGRRGGSSLPFNGHIYSLAVRFGPTLTTEQIEQTETYVNTKTGAY